MTGKEYRTITDVKGPLVFLNKTEPVAFGEIVTLRLSNGTIKNGQVLDTSDDLVIVQVFEGTSKIDREAGVTFMGDDFTKGNRFSLVQKDQRSLHVGNGSVFFSSHDNPLLSCPPP